MGAGRARERHTQANFPVIFTEYETILHDTTNHDILPCKNSEQFQDSRKASKQGTHDDTDERNKCRFGGLLGLEKNSS